MDSVVQEINKEGVKLKFLFLTDTHLTAKNPSSRLDNFELTSLKKLSEIKQIIKLHDIDYVIHGGDMFHTAKVSLRYSGMVAEILKSWEVPIYVVPGNHDIYGYNMATIDQTILGLFEKTNVVKLLTRNKPLHIDVDGLDVLFEGQEYYMNIDKGNNEDFRVNTESDYNILITHSMLMETKFFEGVPHTLIENVKTDADLVLAGHYHNGFKKQFVNGTWFYNPGAVIRVECNRKDLPKVIVFELKNNDGKIDMHSDFITLQTGKPQEEVFNILAKAEKKQAEQIVEEFKNNLVDLQSLQNTETVNDMIEVISKELSIDKTISDLALDFISKAEIEVDDTSSVVKGFVEKDYKLGFKKLTIDNFQSHVHTEIDFKDGLNTITGESNSGKTAILRAILWVLYNEPKGTDFIRTGASSCTVEIEFTDGSKIKRHRTLTSSGTYTVTDRNGEEIVLKGFGSEVPIEVINEHQMPIVNLSKDLKYKLNISSQLEPPFLLCDSPSAKANAVGRLTGVQVIDNAIKNCKSENMSKSKEIKLLENNLKKYEDEISNEKYKDLDVLNEYIELIEELYNIINIKSSEINTLKNYLIKINELGAKKKQILVTLKKLDSVEEAKKLLNESKVSFEEVERLSTYNINLNKSIGNINKHCDALEYINSKLDLICDIRDGQALLEEIETASKYLEKIDKTNNQINIINNKLKHLTQIDKLEDILNEAKTNIESLDTYISINNKINNAISEIDTNNNRIKAIDEKIIQANDRKSKLVEELDEYIKDNRICPVCNGTINLEQFIDGGISNE